MMRQKLLHRFEGYVLSYQSYDMEVCGDTSHVMMEVYGAQSLIEVDGGASRMMKV